MSVELSVSFIIASSFRLPGLGMLVIPRSPEPDWLSSLPLHTPLTITLPRDNQSSIAPLIGTVEEIQHDNSRSRRALLIDLDAKISRVLVEGTQLTISNIQL